MINHADRECLRALAHRQMEISQSQKNQQLIREWYLHNELRGERPMVHVEMDTFEHESIDPRLQCGDSLARELERDLYRAFLNLTEFEDDWPVPDYFGIPWQTWFHPFGHDIKRISASHDSVGHRFEYVIGDLEEDYAKLGNTSFGVDREATMAYRAAAEEAFGDILPVRMIMPSLYAVPTQHIVHLMGMEAMCYHLYDYPELFAEMMNRLADDYLAYYRFLESDGYLLPTVGCELLNQGSKCFTKELKQQAPIALGDTWGFMDSQESVSLSPEMFGAQIFPCYQRIAASYGLLSYGCCEPVDAVWKYISTLPNLRKVSVSPWCDEQKMGEYLRGSKVIYHRKPSANLLGMSGGLDEEAVRAHIRHTLAAAKGCKLEITQRDVYTTGGHPGKVHRYVQLIQEEIERHW